MTDPADHPWPADLLEAVGVAYREAGIQGGDVHDRLRAAEAAFLAAGGAPDDLPRTVRTMILHLADVRFDWLLGPTMDRLEREGERRRAASGGRADG